MSLAITPAITLSDLPAIAPLIALTATALLVMMQAAIARHHVTAVLLTIAGVLVALGTLPSAVTEGRAVTPLLMVDAYVLYCWALLLLVALVVSVTAWSYWRDTSMAMEELYILLLSATLGACVMVASQHFAALFIGLELMTVSLIAMLGYPVADQGAQANRPLEAALKYLVLSAVSSAVLLFGMALIYAETGRLDFVGLISLDAVQGLYLLLGLGLMITGLGFKLSLVPFHLWTPDVYEGAPTPITAFIATLSKAAVLALLVRYVLMADTQSQPMFMGAVTVLAVASMLIGNLLALLQDNPKRLLAYSSIAHMGYALLALLVAGPYGMEAVSFYLAAYLLMTLGAFTALAQLGEPTSVDELRGLLWERPVVGLTLTLMLLSLAGVPLTAGFIGKFYLVGAAVQAQLWAPLTALVLGSVIGLFYYLRVIVIMAQRLDEAGAQGLRLVDVVLLLSCVLGVLLLGLIPGLFAEMLRNIAQLVG